MLGGRPLLAWSLQACEQSSAVDSVVLVVRAEAIEATRAQLAPLGLTKLQHLCEGGEERVDSVRAGLAALPEGTELVAIHDAARPLVSAALIDRVIAAATADGAALAALPVRDTLRRAGQGGSSTTVDRRDLYQAQTPQAFRVELIRRAYETLAAQGDAIATITDDAQLVEGLGHPVRLVEGEAANFKVTTPEDLELAARLLQGASPASGPRTGLGYDAHRLVPGRRLVLGGVELPFEEGLLGHSDADVRCHAVLDALLGAAALGDLGAHFPPDDPRFLDACSLTLLRQVTQLVERAGYRVGNIDSTVVCERPAIAPHASTMRERIADACGVTIDRVSVKATTNERLGTIGRGEGIAALATALLLPRDQGQSAGPVAGSAR